MIELKQVYAGRAQQVFDLCGRLQPQMHEVLQFQERALPEELTTAVLKAWAQKPFVSTTPLQLQVEPVGQTASSWDIFLWVYVHEGVTYATLEDAKFGDAARGWRGL